MKEIEEEAFSDCLALESITLQKGITKIGRAAFYNCAMKSVSIPVSVKTINGMAFGHYTKENDWTPAKISGFTIKGYYLSKAQSYASSNGFTFKGTTNPSAKMTLPTLVNGKLPMKIGQSTSSFKVTGLMSGDSIQSVKSSSTSIVSISNVKSTSATLKAKKKGTAKVTVTLKSGLKKTVTVSVQSSTVKTTKLSGTKTVSVKRGKTTTLKPTRVPFTSQQKITYRSSNRKIATVTSGGKITGKKKGTAYITVKSGSKSYRVKVTVK